MKQIMIILVAFGLAISANAQTKVRGSKSPSRTVIVSAPIYPAWGFGFGYPGFYGRFSPFYDPFYSPFYDPFYRNRIVEREAIPSELQLHLDDIENEYDYQIDKVRNDESLSGKERRQKIRELKYQRENALIDAKRNFLKKENKKDDKKNEQ